MEDDSDPVPLDSLSDTPVVEQLVWLVRPVFLSSFSKNWAIDLGVVPCLDEFQATQAAPAAAHFEQHGKPASHW